MIQFATYVTLHIRKKTAIDKILDGFDYKNEYRMCYFYSEKVIKKGYKFKEEEESVKNAKMLKICKHLLMSMENYFVNLIYFFNVFYQTITVIYNQ